MPFPKIFFVTCPCSKSKRISLSINVDECSEEDDVHTATEHCPHAFETWCHKLVNVPLPPGLKPENEVVDRNPDKLDL